MKRPVLSCWAALTISGCGPLATSPENAPYKPYIFKGFEENDIKISVSSETPYPRTAEYSELLATQDQEGTVRVCGFVTSLNRTLSHYEPYRPFVGILLSGRQGLGLVGIAQTPEDYIAIVHFCQLRGMRIAEPDIELLYD